MDKVKITLLEIIIQNILIREFTKQIIMTPITTNWIRSSLYRFFFFFLSMSICIQLLTQPTSWLVESISCNVCLFVWVFTCMSLPPPPTLSHLKSFIESAVPLIGLFLMIIMMPLKRCVAKENYLIALLSNEARNNFFMSL